jgi:hypothetical protein
MAYTDPRKSSRFVDDNNLRPRDNSGGALHRDMKHSTDFGQTGASVKGGEAEDSGIESATAPEDEIVMKSPRSTRSPRSAPSSGY